MKHRNRPWRFDNYCEGLSYLALDLRFRADGTLDPGALGMEEHQSY